MNYFVIHKIHYSIILEEYKNIYVPTYLEYIIIRYLIFLYAMIFLNYFKIFSIVMIYIYIYIIFNYLYIMFNERHLNLKILDHNIILYMIHHNCTNYYITLINNL